MKEVFKHLSEEGKLFDAERRWHPDLRMGELNAPRAELAWAPAVPDSPAVQCHHRLRFFVCSTAV